jgi:hypothetical protein
VSEEENDHFPSLAARVHRLSKNATASTGQATASEAREE